MNDSAALFDPAAVAMADPAVATLSPIPGSMSCPGPSTSPPPSALASPPAPGSRPDRGSVLLNALMLRRLRESRLLSQQELADDFDLHNIQISIATIKRVECSHRVRYRIARTLATYYDVPVEDLLT